MPHQVGWEKLRLAQDIDWDALKHVKKIDISLEHRDDMIVAEIKYDDGRQDVVAYVKKSFSMAGSVAGGPAST